MVSDLPKQQIFKNKKNHKQVKYQSHHHSTDPNLKSNLNPTENQCAQREVHTSKPNNVKKLNALH